MLKIHKHTHIIFHRSIGNTDMHDFSPDALMTLHQFTLKQRLMIEENPKLLPVVGKGAWMAIGECHRQFRDERWNCTNYSSESVFGKILNIGKYF